jgi:hypothetical protein
MTQHFTIFGGAFVHEARGFYPVRRRSDPLAVWGVVLATLLFGVVTAASVTATAWAHAAILP